MTEVKFTPEQEEAIHSQGHNILVSASAGSGKTFVMANRIVEKIKNGIDIESLFISTFTKKAAAELRMRLEKDLKKASYTSQDSGEKQRIKLALQKLPHADIGTMDSFTQKLLRENFNRVDIDPNFRILADQTESDLLKQEVFDELIEQYLSEYPEIKETAKIDKKTFEKLVKNFSRDRNIKGFQSVVYTVYRFASATENPENWLNNEFLKGFEFYQRFSDLPESFSEDVFLQLKNFILDLQKALTEKNLTGKTLEKAQIVVDNQEYLLGSLTRRDYLQFTEIFRSLDFSRWSLKKDEILAESFKSVIGTKTDPGLVRNFLEKIKHLSTIEKYQPEAKVLAENLQKFVLYFYNVYLERKRSENAFEYSDIAHFAIKILEENSDVATAYRNKYSEIMIDEYQDTSHVQEAMLRLLSKNGDGTDNIFMVGDIKQSIYGFRLADPSLFLKKYTAYADEENPNQLIRLKENFRSRGEVLSFTNEVFKHLMDEEVGEMIYGEEEKLVQGNLVDYPQQLDENFYPQLLIYEEEALEDESEQMSDGEIKIVAQKIKELIASDENLEYKDIALLVRSKTQNNKIEDILKAYDIPVVLDEGRVDFLKSLEVTLILDVLRAIDNPLYDIPLVATLRSPMFNFTEDELTRISLNAGSDTRFWQKLQLSDGELINKALKAKINSFLERFTSWRKLVNEVSIHELLWKIYTETYYMDYVGALPNGELRQANLHALSIRAESYESAGYKGLFRFIKMIDKFMEQNNDLASVNIKLPQNAVRVMTFHKSKGLEFDVVFLMNLQTKFNQKDLRDSVILTRENGLGMKYTADLKNEAAVETEFPYALVKMETLPYLVNKDLKRNAMLSEEMRVLYVAFTRAKKKLYMVGKIKPKDLEKYGEAKLEKGILPLKYRQAANGFQHWLLALQKAHKLPMNFKVIKAADLQGIDKKFTVYPDFKKLSEDAKKFDKIMDSLSDVKQARAILDYQYPKLAATKLSSIQTPSQVKKRSYEKQLELGNVLPSSEYERVKQLEMLDFGQHKITAAEIGSATHSFMQYADFSRPNLFDFQQTLDQMDLLDEVKNKIDLPKILTLFDTDFGKLLVENVDRTTKEAPFSMLKTDEVAQEQYIVRGICDGFIKFEDKIILFDYKTDYFSNTAQIVEIKKNYEVQMELYADALRKAYHVNQVDKYLILLGGPRKVIVERI
ncbi:helicase-exonuclease AddAB subunit AddA [Lactococcus formosensis]|uniref:ATP-dependent helicase/nuclease subunit A n=1 Tax=Lactococcus formosensis TaxID=1281486 RepID=A0A9X4P022_9LACT|nr:helicase-exonuclease AddAB subunit AddA [Lactococcus formosensis]MDG6111722.1 helicase-exonuclease AddAB subunit AddA [Lactococcus formosensis]MDG6117922.1 helicase-exonuclease AddAB subunit AddA [Lactococcus formosensis]MDG6132638.1 helicase-exonuclease AddAB subunit AddA [Lactococcus formosensis]MDG6134633.1 helicase-exonuclease AddAB subunit AddA [Lactococcus formosensis]MDG6138325.1 helicase-exonuclease AddAB subunit AddA [Lactococcus formosensis]